MVCSYFRVNRYNRFAQILIFTPFVAADGCGTVLPEYAVNTALSVIWIPLCDFEYPNQLKIKLYWPIGHSTKIDRSIDTMPRSILLFFVSIKPAIQGISPIGVCKILCIAGSFCVMGLLRHFQLKSKYEYPMRKNKIVLWKITEFYEK